ncbi:helix-turn-helix domain-containing protein [Paenibacillus ehimensis]|uniref:helix-turn-helix domain-containing protein n=1 Tax=Paenibacillus ehimensis TaxID=79264 RepID=UPI000472A523|nr:helix-turn-helix transcriptional regulator [Paenibacillus ehimensis]
MEIAEKIHNLMAERGITKYRLAKESKVPYTTLTKILDGTTKNPQVDSLKLIADYFGKPLDYFTGKEERQSPEWATAKDKRDLEKYLADPSGLYYKGHEFSEADRAKLIGVMEAMFWEARKQNKEAYKKSREKKTKTDQ